MRDLFWIRRQLYHWGVLCRARGIGYPTMAATEQARIGRGGAFDGPSLPPDLEEIDHAVFRLEPEHKIVIVECYTHYGTHSDHMIRLRLPPRTYFRKKNSAETRVNTLLTCGSELLTSVAA